MQPAEAAVEEIRILEHGPAELRERFSQLDAAGGLVGDRDTANFRALE
jgi:hypothetical protein